MHEYKADETAKRNDAFRIPGKLRVTRGVQVLVDDISVLGAVMTFGAFTEDNDPDGEHNFCNCD